MATMLFSRRFSLLLVIATVFCCSQFSYAVAPARASVKPAATANATTATTSPAPASSNTTTPAATSAPVEVIAQVIWVKGDMKAAQPNKPARVLERRSAIYLHDVITTSASGTGQIAFTDGSTYALRTGTVFKIDGYHHSKDGPAAEEKSIMELVKGGFRTITGAIPKKNPDGYQMNSPVATIGVRGTEYTTFISEDKGLLLEINVGTIEVANQAGKMVLSQCDISANCQRYGSVLEPSAPPMPLPVVPKELAGQPALAPVSPKTVESISSSSIPAPAESAPAPAASSGNSDSSSSGSSSSSSGSSDGGSSDSGTGSTGGDSSSGGSSGSSSSSDGSSGSDSSSGSSSGSTGGDASSTSSSSSSGPTVGGPDTGGSGTANTGGSSTSTGGGSTTITVTPPTGGSSAPKAVGGFCVGMLKTVFGKTVC